MEVSAVLVSTTAGRGRLKTTKHTLRRGGISVSDGYVGSLAFIIRLNKR